MWFILTFQCVLNDLEWQQIELLFQLLNDNKRLGECCVIAQWNCKAVWDVKKMSDGGGLKKHNVSMQAIQESNLSNHRGKGVCIYILTT